MSDIDPDFFDAVDRLSRDPSFCGYRLARLREEKGQTPQQQADELGITPRRLVFLALSRMPRDRTDLDALAWQLGMETGRLAALLGAPRGR